MSTTTRGHRHPGHTHNVETQEGLAEKPDLSGQKVSAEEQSRSIQVRAYGLWEQAGKPGGDAARERCWYEAEAEILASHATNE
jgi:hypothetical protein